MVGYLSIAVFTFLASFLSFFSGFGLGTILMPVIAIFFPLEIAIALTAIVHLLHNVLKTGFLWRAIDWKVAIRFGLVALIASIPGALLLKELSGVAPISEYTFLGIKGAFSILHICIGFLLILFATLEAFPLKTFRFKNLVIGGVVSGFFGGLSGNQGAFRSLFLINTNLNKNVFIGTNACIAVFVDIVRLVVYSLSFHHLLTHSNVTLLSIATIASIAGVVLGAFLLEKVTIGIIQKMIVILLYLFGCLLILGII